MVFPGRHQEMLDMGSDLVLFSVLFSFISNNYITYLEINPLLDLRLMCSLLLFCLGNFNHNLLFADLVISIATNCDLLVIIMLVVIETK